MRGMGNVRKLKVLFEYMYDGNQYRGVLGGDQVYRMEKRGPKAKKFVPFEWFKDGSKLNPWKYREVHPVRKIP